MLENLYLYNKEVVNLIFWPLGDHTTRLKCLMQVVFSI